MIQLLEQLVSFKTTADNPEEISRGFQYISSLFDPQVFDSKLLEKNGKYSLLISFKGKDSLKPKVLLNGHFDVVPAEDGSQYQVRIEGNNAFGRGTADMKGMVAVLIEVMQKLGKQNNLPDIALLLDGDEEVGGEDGAGYAVKELGLMPQLVLCADATHDEQEIIVKEKGGLWIELKSQGKTAHGAYLWKGENALDKLLGAIEKIKKFVGPTEAEAWKSTCNLAVIETTNKTPNKVPEDAKAILDIRFTEALAKSPGELLEKIKALVPEVQAAALTDVSLLFVNESNPLLQRFSGISNEVLGKAVPLHYAHGATDARYFGEAGIPAVIFGARGGEWHAAGEWVDLESLEKGKEILLRFLQTLDSNP